MRIKPMLNRSDVKKVLYAVSLDADGCVYNKRYLNEILEKLQNILVVTADYKDTLIDNNRLLFNELYNTITTLQPSKMKLMVGSARQSRRIDFPTEMKLPITTMIMAIRDQINTHLQKINFPLECSVDTYLLSDTFGETRIGKNFELACNKDSPLANAGLRSIFKTAKAANSDTIFSDWVFDASKISIVYAQIHRLASQNPDDKIIYEFVDDREDIINPLFSFFQKNPDLIPNNVTINFHLYGRVESITNEILSDVKDPIQGTGIIDHNYHETILQMARSISSNSDFNYKKEEKFLEKLSADNWNKIRISRRPESEGMAQLCRWLNLFRDNPGVFVGKQNEYEDLWQELQNLHTALVETIHSNQNVPGNPPHDPDPAIKQIVDMLSEMVLASNDMRALKAQLMTRAAHHISSDFITKDPLVLTSLQGVINKLEAVAFPDADLIYGKDNANPSSRRWF